MKTLKRICQAFLLCAALTSCGNTFKFSPDTVISVENEEQRAVADWFAWLFARSGGFVLQVTDDALGADVVMRGDMSLEPSAFRIKVTEHRTCIEASSPIGFFYAFQYIWHLLPEDINACCHADHVEWKIPVMSMCDSPLDGYAGLVLDLCRRLLPKDNAIHLIEVMPHMGIYDLILVNDGCYTNDELFEVYSCAASHRINLISEHKLTIPAF